MSPLRAKLVRLAHANPGLRPHLLPVLTARTGPEATLRDLQIALEVASGYLDALARDVARDPALEARRSVQRALTLANGELAEAVRENASGSGHWF